MSEILIPEYLLNFARDIYEGPLPSNFGERLIEAKYVKVLENWYKVFGGKIPANHGKRMVPNYLLLFIRNLANADFIEYVDDTVAYVKETPQKALKYAFLNMVGGMSYEGDFEGIRDSAVTSVNDYAIPTEIQSLEGYGWGVNDTCYNYIDLEAKKFIQNVKEHTVSGSDSISLSVTPIVTDEENSYIRGYVRNLPTNKNYLDLLMAGFNSQPVSVWDTRTPAEFISVDTNEGNVLFSVSTTKAGVDFNSFKNWLIGKKIRFGLATPIETNISEYLGDNIIDVSGGTTTFNNEYNQEVPSEIVYYVEA